MSDRWQVIPHQDYDPELVAQLIQDDVARLTPAEHLAPIETVDDGDVPPVSEQVRRVPLRSSDATANAATIVAVGRRLGVSRRGCAEALACALVESGLHNLDYGDQDSLGLFQQRGSWGSAAHRTDPTWAATAFFVGVHAADGWHPGLTSFSGWASKSFTAAIYEVQRCAVQYASRYGAQESSAQALLTTLLPSGSFPLPKGHWFGVDDGTDASHSGARAEDIEHVKAVQRMVGATDDGNFGPHTEALVAAWKVAHGLDHGGQVGAVTWPAMVRS